MLTTQALSFQHTDNGLTDDNYATGTLAIQEKDYHCYQNLECLKRNNPFKSSNLDQIIFNPDRYKQYIIEGSSRNESVYAVYNEKGNLMKATVVQRNIVLPKTIYKTLTGDEFSSWKMIGNELVVQNFDQNSMTYKIILSRDGEVKVEYFDGKGNKISPIS